MRANKPKYGKAFLYGAIAGIGIAIALALLAMAIESEYLIALVAGLAIEIVVILKFIPGGTASSAFIGAILSVGTYLLYYAIMLLFGYQYAEDADSKFWIMTIGSIIAGAWMGYKGDN